MIEELPYKEGLQVYREFLELPEATPFHRPGWLEFLKGLFRGEIKFLVWHQGGFPSGVMPFLEVRKLFLRAAYSLPLDAPGGALGSPPPPSWHLAFRKMVRVRVADHRRVIESPWRKVVLLQHRINLSSPLKPSSTRLKELRQSQRRGVEVSLEKPKPEHYALYREVKARRGGFLLSEGEFLRAASAVPSRLWAARVGGELAAFLLVFYHGSWAYTYLHGFRARFAKARPFVALLFHAIESARSEGREVFHLGLTNPDDEGVRKFKLSFGAEEFPYVIHYKRVI